MNSAKFQDTKSICRNLWHFLYNSIEISEREIKKTIQVTITSKRIKYLGINLTKEVKGLYTENSKTDERN